MNGLRFLRFKITILQHLSQRKSIFIPLSPTQFMHLANRSAIWQDRMGAAFGVAHLAKSAGKELEPFLAKILPRMYRYVPTSGLSIVHLDFIRNL